MNSIVVEALAVEREPEIECNLEFRIPLIKSIENVVYDIVCDIAYDMKTRTYNVLPRTYDVVYDL